MSRTPLALRAYEASKRAVDLLASSAGLVVSAPIQLGVAAAIRATMGSPVLFRQQRPGKDGKLFTMVKFRTMRTGAASDAARLTRLGKFLRATSLDELPSLWNVAAGQMSLVGPRPLLPEYLPRYSPRQARRHEVRPGITGLAQVSGRNALGWDERFELDVQYVEQRSWRLDLWILGQTVRKVLVREGISAEGEATMSKFQGSEG